MKSCVIALLLLVAAVSGAVAEPLAEADIPVRYANWHIRYDVNADGSYIETQRWTSTILKESALEREKSSAFSFSTSVAKGEVLEAYTLKKSGQRIDVPKNSYQVTVQGGYKKASPLYSDETTISVVFPELSVGDSTVFSSRITSSEGMFPNQFSLVRVFSRYLAYDDVTVELSVPVEMKLQRQSFFLAGEPPVIQNGKQLWRWTHRNRIPEKWDPADNGITVIGEDPSLFVSTFRSYREIAEAYGLRATPKAAVTERVKKLATEIAGGAKTPAAQARAIYDWVTKNISYGGNCFGIGTVVPRDLDVVLDNKMGDCKDHATLLQALLAAKGIDSGQALVNTAPLYQFPDIPVAAAVNHVINYLPGQDLFLDSTTPYTPFGMLPDSLAQKPVLLVSPYREGAKIPSMAQYGHEQVMLTSIRIDGNGSATGSMTLKLKGLPGVAARMIWRNVPPGQEEFVAKTLLEAQGTHGSGSITKDDPTELLDTYSYTIVFKLEDYVTVGSATGIPVRPVAVSIFPIEGFLKDAYAPLPTKQYQCNGGTSIEEYHLEFPDSLKLVAVPKDVTLSTPSVDYAATYRKSANSLTVRRELKDKTPSNVCSPEYAAEYRKVMLSIAKDMKSQIIIGD